MDRKLDFETALEILQSDIFDDDLSYIGAVMFVAEAFGLSVDSVLENIPYLGVNFIIKAVDRALDRHSSDNVDVVRNEETGMVDVIYHSDNNSFTIYEDLVDFDDLSERDKETLVRQLDKRYVGHCW